MKYLLDTVVWLWSLDSVERLNHRALDLLNSGEKTIYFSAATAWEVSIKASLGKLQLPSPPAKCVPAFTERQRLRALPVTNLHAVKVYDLPHHHRDPFDRLIIAQAMAEELTILTADNDFKKYSVDLVWCAK
jgi:PIN domain nuclease of toxin-antitoxin system